jgi:hypothetical protein
MAFQTDMQAHRRFQGFLKKKDPQKRRSVSVVPPQWILSNQFLDDLERIFQLRGFNNQFERSLLGMHSTTLETVNQ